MPLRKGKQYSISLATAKRLRRKRVLMPAEYKRRLDILSALEKTSECLAIETDIKLILGKIARTVGETLGAKYVNFWEFTPDRKATFITATYGMQKQYLEHSRKDPMPLGAAWIGRAMQTGETWASSDVPKDPNLPKSWLPAVKKQDYHGLICAPLLQKGKITGGMCIYYKDVHEFDYFEMSLVTIVANQAATAVENARIFGDLMSERLKTFSIIQSLNDGLIMYDTTENIIFFNPRAEEFLWLKSKDLIGKHIDEKLGNQNVYYKNLYHISQLVQNDYASKEYITEGPQKLVLMVTKIPVRDQKRRKIGTMHILHDITREKEVEHLKIRFISTASHQLRTPLSAIKWSLDILIKGERGPLAKEQKELATKIFDITERLVGLLNDLLDVSRIEEGKFGYTFVLTKPTEVAEKVFNDLKINFEERNINFTFEKSTESMPQVSIDKKKFEIAVQNIIDNAIKYTLPGGFVKAKFQKEKNSLFLIVKDNGIGIPLKDQKFIFHKFFRAENAIRLQTEGSGLGLYIAKSIVEKHNGLIHFESAENRGSTFMIQLPLNPEKMPKGSMENF